MKGIVLAGGTGSRLFPLTLATSKQLLPVYDKPMVYYPLATLMQAGIKEIAIISTARDLPSMKGLLGTGSSLGLQLTYIEQPKPEGIAQAFLLAASFILDDSVALILGDNLFFGYGLTNKLRAATACNNGAHIFGYEVQNPSRYGVLSFDAKGRVNGIIEKPSSPPSSYAVTGLYFYDNRVIEVARGLTPSKRGELEITDVNSWYLENSQLDVTLLERGTAWLDTGTITSLDNAANYVKTIQARQGIQIGCIEEIAYKNEWISLDQLAFFSQQYGESSYGSYLKDLCEREKLLV